MCEKARERERHTKENKKVRGDRMGSLTKRNKRERETNGMGKRK